MRQWILGRFEDLKKDRAIVAVEDQGPDKKKIVFAGNVSLVVLPTELVALKARFKVFPDGV